MSILEGICPDCQSPAAIVRVGGTSDFHEQYGFQGDHPVETWERGVTEIGEVEIECEQEHRNSAFALANGDWV